MYTLSLFFFFFFFLLMTSANANLLTMAVSGFRDLLFPPYHPPNPHLHHSPTNPNSPNYHLPNTSPLQSRRDPSGSSASLRPRHLNHLRSPPLRHRHPGSPPLPAPNRLYRRRDRAPTGMVDNAHGGLRDLRARLDPTFVSPSDPQSGAREGPEARVA